MYGVDRERNLHHHHPLWSERTLKVTSPDLPDKTEVTHSETPKETDDTNDPDNVPVSETPLNDNRDASHKKPKSSVDTADGVRQRLKLDGEASGMTPDPKRSKETAKQGEIRESNALPGESPERKKVRFLPDSGDGGAAAVTVEELVEDYWSDEHGQGQMFEGLHCKVEPDLDTINTEAALDRLLEHGVVRDIPSAEGAGMKPPDHHVATMSGSSRFASWDTNTDGRNSGKTCLPRELRTALDVLWTSSRSNVVCPPSFWTARMLTTKLPSWMVWWLNHLKCICMSTDIWWKLQKQLPGRRQAGQRWVDHFTSALVDKLCFTRCLSAPQFLWNPDRQV